MYGGIGDDVVFVGSGADVADGGDGIDTLYTTSFAGNYVINLATGVTNFSGKSFINFEWLFAGIGNDNLTGTSGINLLYGGGGKDTIYGGGGKDYVYGGIVDGQVHFGDGNDEAYGGDGRDVVRSVSNLNYIINLATGLTSVAGEFMTGFEDLVSGGGNDRLTGTSGTNFIYGGAGNDTIDSGNGGNDASYDGDGDHFYLRGVRRHGRGLWWERVGYAGAVFEYRTGCPEYGNWGGLDQRSCAHLQAI